MTAKTHADFEAYDMKAEKKAHAEDMAQQELDAQAEMRYLIALDFAQLNGGLAGYDPYD